MRQFTRIGAIALLTLVPAGAKAADLVTYPIGTEAALPVAEDTGFDWSGFYAGVYGVAQFSPEWGTQYGAGVQAGVNAQFDFVLVGAEVALQGVAGEALDTTYGQVVGRAGALLTDNVLVYAAAGYGLDVGAPEEDDVLVGAGIEFAVSDDLSVGAQYLHGFPLTGDNPKEQVSLGARFHF